MRSLLQLLIFVPFFALSQENEGKVWCEAGVSGKLTNDLTWGVDLSTRFGNYGLETFFPQASLKYKVTKWFRPSIDYRLIGDRKYFDVPYSFSHRINFNAEFKHVIDRFTLKARIRYQFAFNRVTQNYDAEFDQAVRLKMEGLYDIDKFFLSPVIAAEVFFDPNYGEFGQRFNKYRVFIGVDSDFKGPHSFSVGYLYDSKINVPNIKRRHVLSLSYGYEIPFDSKKENKK
ncbi:MAG: DUF2490 domain-containing protein [Bacteroidota bacterium]